MTTNNRLVALATLLAALVVVPRADATLAKAASFDEKVENAAAIVLGQVVKQEARWDADHRWILTYSTIRIEKAYKGLAADREITIVTPGGTVGDVHQDTIGVPDFVPGADNVVFIRNSSAGPTVLYFDQGAYAVAKDGSERIVRPVESEAVTIDTQRGMAVAPEEPRTLQEFERAIRTSEARARVNKMELIRKQQAAAESTSTLRSTLTKYKLLIVLALAGAAVATIQLIRR